MTDTHPIPSSAMPTGKIPLGIGSIIGDTFRVFGRHFVMMSLVAFVPIFLAGLLLLPFETDPDDVSSSALVGTVLGVVLMFAAGGITQAIIIQMAYNDRVGQRSSFGAMLRRAFAKVLYITVLSLVVGLTVGLGFVALIVPGLWLYGALAVVAPAIVVEDANWRGMGRSWSLTKGYRWSIVGLISLAYIPLLIGGFIAIFLGFTVFEMPGGITYLVLESALTAIMAPIFNLAIVLAYARLREIKEGITVDRIAEVFA